MNLTISLKFILLVSLGLVLPSCAGESEDDRSRVNGIGIGGQEGGGSSAGDGTASVVTAEEAFEANLNGVFVSNCSSCHTPDAGSTAASPYFATSNSNNNMNNLINARKINFDHFEKSTLVEKIKSGHNCLDKCDTIASSILDGLMNWENQTTESTSFFGSKTKDFATPKLSYSDAIILSGKSIDSSKTVLIEAESGTPGEGVVFKDDSTASGGSLIETTSAGGGKVTYVVNIPSAGNYRMFARYFAISLNDITLNVKTNGVATAWKAAGHPEFAWAGMKDASGDVLTVSLEAGENTMEFEPTGLEYQFDYFALSKDMELEEVSPKDLIKTLEFDLNGNGKFLIDVAINSDTSFVFSKPRIDSQKEVSIRNIRIGINGSFDKKNATYSEIEDKVAPGDTRSLSATSMVVLSDKGISDDIIEFSFEQIVFR